MYKAETNNVKEIDRPRNNMENFDIFIINR